MAAPVRPRARRRARLLSSDLHPLPARFFARPTLTVARDLLGRLVVRRLDGVRIVARIVETEAYIGESDLACHASRGRTPRNDLLYRRPGTLYVYFTYGLHWLVNVVSEREGFPAAVLLRAAEVLEGDQAVAALRPGRSRDQWLRGPASLCRGLGIDGSLNGMAVPGPGLWLARGAPVADREVAATARIGVDYAGRSRDNPWRFVVVGSRAVSGKRVVSPVTGAAPARRS